MRSKQQYDLFSELSENLVKSDSPEYICGVDEAGRGPLAGRVYAAAVILDPKNPIEGLADSKILTESQRDKLFVEITDKSLAYFIAYAEVAEIEQLNILQATFLAMQRSIAGLSILPSMALIDGNHIPPMLTIKAQAIIKGDSKVAEISAASILAKVSRDNNMRELDQQYPEYGFAKHKGYGTKEHIAAIEKYGILPVHRKTFAPIRNY